MAANRLAAPRLAPQGSAYPLGIAKNYRVFDGSRNWPVWSPVAAMRKPLIGLLVLLLAGCRGTPAPVADSAPRRGGELVASLRSEPANYNRYFDASAAADVM